MHKASMIFYGNYYEAIQLIENPAARLEAYETLVSYGITGEKPKIKSKEAEMIFIFAQYDVRDKI